MGCCLECGKTLSLFVWWIRFKLWLLWKTWFGCRTLDQALDEISDSIEHKHNISRRAPKARPVTFHQTRDHKHRTVKPVKVHYPHDRDELIRTVRTCRKFRPVGSGLCWREMIDTGEDGVLISLASMNQLLEVDHKNLQVTFGAGIVVRDAIQRLHQSYGLALINMGSYDRETLGGAIAGGTHGTSGAGAFRLDTFSSSIVELKMVTAQGGDITLEPFESVTYGVGGIIYQVTLKVVPFYYLRKITTTVEPSLIDFQQWFDFDYGSWMAKWYLPNHQFDGFCKLMQLERASEQDFYGDRQIALRERRDHVFLWGAMPFLPRWKLRRTAKLLQESNFVDTYFRQYVEDPAVHQAQWEYAVPLDNDPSDLVAKIPESVRHIPFPCEVSFRISPKDAAVGHLAHEHDVVWFNLSVVVPDGKLTRKELDSLAEPFEQLMATSGKYPVLAHPQKLIVDPERVGLTQDKVDFLASFQYTHDPKGKMFNDSLIDLLRGRKPKLGGLSL